MSAVRHRPIVALMLVLDLGACTTWRPVTVSPRQFIEEEQPDRIRVWQDERGTEFRHPRIDGDTLTSMVPNEPGKISLTDVTLIEVRRFSYGRTVFLVLGVGVALFSQGNPMGEAGYIISAPECQQSDIKVVAGLNGFSHS